MMMMMQRCTEINERLLLQLSTEGAVIAKVRDYEFGLIKQSSDK
jgi:hypothetical protein